ncbi:MAG: hypothetical protein GDA51_12965, partial [Ekhidna sp.]|nr:hypothetical protein [Ekhidna sp.]
GFFVVILSRCLEFLGAVVSLVKPPRCWKPWRFFCGDIVSLFKPSRC